MISPREEKLRITYQAINGDDTVNIDHLVWIIAKLEDRIKDLEDVIVSMQETTKRP